MRRKDPIEKYCKLMDKYDLEELQYGDVRLVRKKDSIKVHTNIKPPTDPKAIVRALVEKDNVSNKEILDKHEKQTAKEMPLEMKIDQDPAFNDFLMGVPFGQTS